MDPPPDLSAFRGQFTEDTEQCESFGSNGTSGPRPKRQRASGASSSDEVSSRRGLKGLFCTPLAEASRRAHMRAMVASPPLTPHSKWKIMGSFWGWRWAFFGVAHWFVLVGTFILGLLGLFP